MNFILKNDEIYLSNKLVAYKDLNKWHIIDEKNISIDLYVELSIFIYDIKGK